MKQFNTTIAFVTVVIAVVGVTSTTRGAVLIGHWGFEEGSGPTAFDSTGNNLDGVITNATYTTGKVGAYALNFNGANAFVEIANNALLVPNTIGISLWFKARNSQQADADLLDKGHGSGSSPYNAGYAFQYAGNTSSIGTFYGTGPITKTFVGTGTGTGYKDDIWHHLAVNLGQDAIELYVDGDLINSLPGQGSLVQNDSNLYFGRHRALGRYFNGLLDEIRLYDGRLTQADVDALVPEPTTTALLAMGAIALLKRRRRA